MGYLTEDLLESSPFDEIDEKKSGDGIFRQSLMEELCFHYDNNELFRSFCDNKSFNPHDFNGDLSGIPPVQVSVFKELGRELGSVPREKIKLTLQSSATSGTPSSVPVDAITSKRQAKAMIKVVGDFIGNERRPFLIMDVDPMSGFREILGARYAAVSGYLNFASKVGYFLKVSDRGIYYFDTEGIREYINSTPEPVVVFGFTYILYSEVVRPLHEQDIAFKLPDGSKVIHIGGWKKLESEKVSKDKFNGMTASVFGIRPEDVIDIYGFTEQMGLNYPDCPCGCKHVSLYSDVVVRDVITKELVPDGNEGLLEFITPIPHSYPGNVVLTDDIGELVPGTCPYGRQGKRFRVLGRLKKAEIRGCGDILSGKLKFADTSNVFSSGKDSDLREGKVRMVQMNLPHPSAPANPSSLAKRDARGFWFVYNGEFDDKGMRPDGVVAALAYQLKEQISWLRKQPIDALIGLIAQVSKKWPHSRNVLSDTQDYGLDFLVKWCTPEHLVQIANEGLRGNRKYADGFTSVADSNVRSMRAISKGLACHWLAGNVQVLGMFVLIQSILSKNVNMLRVSARDNGAFQSLLAAFKGEVYTTRGGYSIRGDDLLHTIALVYFNHSDKKTGWAMSEAADARIAWGGSEAVTTVAAYPSKFDCEDIIMGPKLSFSVISREVIADERMAKKLARKVAVDASVFEQTGCASTHNVFVEDSGGVSPEEFAALLAEAMSKLSKQMPKGHMTPEEFAAVHSARGIFDFKGTVYGDDESKWTVLYSGKTELNSPVYSRVVFVHPVENILDAAEYIDENIQTIGLAADGRKKTEFASAAAERGANRFPVCGRMLNFESPWDGMFIMDRLVNWVTLGGPLV